MAVAAIRSAHATHEVDNQSPPLAGYNVFEADRALVEAVSREGGDFAVDRIRAVGDETLIGAVTSNTMVGYPVAIDVWIDKETNDLLKVVLVEPPSAEKETPATWTLELSRQNDDITIEPPEVEGEPAPSGTP